MNYAERLAEFVRVTGHKPGEMNRKDYEPAGRKSSGITAPPDRGEALHSLEPPAQSAGPGRCNRYVKVVRGFASPCVLDAWHEGGHEL